MISPDFVSKAYNAGDPPVSKDLPDLNYLVLNHIPVRSTSKLLLQEEASPTKNLVFSKKDGRRGDENFQTMAAGVVSKVEQMLQNFAAGTAGGQAKLQDKSSTFQSESVMFQPKQKALALPSTMVQTTPSGLEDSKKPQAQLLPCSKQLGCEFHYILNILELLYHFFVLVCFRH